MTITDKERDALKDEKINREYGTIIRDAFNRRSESDYGEFVTFDKAEVEKMFDDMIDFISTIEKYIRVN